MLRKLRLDINSMGKTIYRFWRIFFRICYVFHHVEPTDTWEYNFSVSGLQPSYPDFNIEICNEVVSLRNEVFSLRNINKVFNYWRSFILPRLCEFAVHPALDRLTWRFDFVILIINYLAQAWCWYIYIQCRASKRYFRWFSNPMKTIAISTTSRSYWSYKPT